MSFSQLVKGIIKGEFNESYTPYRNNIFFYGILVLAVVIPVIGFLSIDPFGLVENLGREI